MAHRIPFRYRAHEVSRLEAFSDVVFGFSLSLIVISLEVPKTYDELMETLRGVLPFGFCFLIFIGLWLAHHEFFKRYALQDKTTIFLNSVMLFVLLFYIYPMKFMFVLMAKGLTGHTERMTVAQAQNLFLVYGIGFAAVNWLFAAMYRHADRKHAELDLNPVERLDTREKIYDSLFTGAFGVLSIVFAYTYINLAGPIYFLLFVPKTAVGWIMGVRRGKIEDAMLSPQPPRPDAPHDRPKDTHSGGGDRGNRSAEAIG
jgi:uncharacterized membrane protein